MTDITNNPPWPSDPHGPHGRQTGSETVRPSLLRYTVFQNAHINHKVYKKDSYRSKKHLPTTKGSKQRGKKAVDGFVDRCVGAGFYNFAHSVFFVLVFGMHIWEEYLEAFYKFQRQIHQIYSRSECLQR